jgi:hypothetical protein
MKGAASQAVDLDAAESMAYTSISNSDDGDQ